MDIVKKRSARAFKYKSCDSDIDRNIQYAVAKDGLHPFGAWLHVCFGRTVEDLRKERIKLWNKDNPDNPITNIEVWQCDSVSNMYGDTRRCDQFLDELKSWNLFRNCTVERLPNKKLPTNVKNHWGSAKENQVLLKFTFPIDIKPQEIWFVGWVVRHITVHPWCIVNFLKLKKLHPEINPLQLFLTSFSVQLNKNPSAVYQQHLMVSNVSVLQIKDITVEDVHKDIDTNKKYKPFLESGAYNFEGGMYPKFLQINGVNSNGLLVGTNLNVSFAYRNNFERYSKEVLNSWFDGEVFRKLYITGLNKKEIVNAFSFSR